MEQAETERIVKAIKLGDSESYGKLVEAYQQQIFRYCFHMLGQLQEAEDVTQDVFVKGFERFKQYQEGTYFGAWLYKIAYRECLNKLKRAKTYERLIRLFVRTAPRAESDRAPDAEYNAELRQAMLRLNPEDRHIILLRIVEENRFEDIAEQLNMSYAAVRKRYERAKRRLKNGLSEKEGESDEQGRSLSY
ncbi:RNA polymerase sigma factor [Cohnella cellulosilytica]|uniref:RNA polymerase sigma factor n=1 Tax=Cohnella cellulosilytica TaxID=986710 RepID=A0ABW2FGK9_9BACL